MKSILFLTLVVSLAAVTGCRLHQNSSDGSGTIECTQVSVAPQVAGRILKLVPHEGDRVKQGDLVAQLDPRDHELKRDELRAGLAQAQAQLDLLIAGAREEDIQRARDQVREAEAAAGAARSDLQRIEQVFARQSATQKQLDDARLGVDRTAALLAQTQQGLARLVNGSRPEEIRAAQAQVQQIRARLAQVEKSIADCAVTAPMEGTVTVRVREDGEFAAVGSPLITLSRLDEVWLSIYVAEDRLGRVKLGQTARVKVDGDAKLHEGKVTFISPEAEFTPKNVQTPSQRAKLVYRVKITLPNPDGIFKPGMPADGYFTPAG